MRRTTADRERRRELADASQEAVTPVTGSDPLFPHPPAYLQPRRALPPTEPLRPVEEEPEGGPGGEESGTCAVERPAGVTGGPERQLAVAQWLLSAAQDVDRARVHWQQGSHLALLACGGIFSAVRVPAHLVWAATGSEDLAEVDARLRTWFDGGAAIMDLHSHHYYFLVPTSAAPSCGDHPRSDVAVLGRDHYLGVPPVSLTEPGGRSYWSVPMWGPGALCYMDEVEQLIQRGRAARDEADNA
ncbi:hypothetical protein AB0O01_10995 [Streptomyces sp. NPDC093252]|uniref:hypothetical protein n=1 Tax=Streptomyces sp. NPDC093252 TaxID=3154980 RepID=UPI00343C918C